MELVILKLVKIYCATILISKSPKHNVYHSIDHTKEVFATVVEKVAGHEEISAMFASNFLSEKYYNSEKIKQVVEIIISSRVPQLPKNHLQKIVWDADLHHFGKKSFEERNNLFKTESEYYHGKSIPQEQFLNKTIGFMNRHHFFTDYAKQNLEPIKQKNFEMLNHQLNSLQK